MNGAFNTSIKAPGDAVVLWAIHKAGELARAELYFAFALESARAGKLELALDVAIEAVGHVTMEDPRLHLLLGQIAVVRGDGRLVPRPKRFSHSLAWILGAASSAKLKRPVPQTLLSL